MADMDQIKEKCENAIAAGREALDKYTPEEHPIDYARACNSIGGAYGTLANLEETGDKADNCKKACVSFEQALMGYTLKEHPIEYAKTNSNLGNAYAMLASVEDRDANCIKAFQAFLEAFKVFKDSDDTEAMQATIQNIHLHLQVCEKLRRKLEELFIK